MIKKLQESLHYYSFCKSHSYSYAQLVWCFKHIIKQTILNNFGVLQLIIVIQCIKNGFIIVKVKNLD